MQNEFFTGWWNNWNFQNHNVFVFFLDNTFQTAVADMFVDIQCAKARWSTVGTIRGKTMPGISLTFAFYTYHRRHQTLYKKRDELFILQKYYSV